VYPYCPAPSIEQIDRFSETAVTQRQAVLDRWRHCALNMSVDKPGNLDVTEHWVRIFFQMTGRLHSGMPLRAAPSWRARLEDTTNWLSVTHPRTPTLNVLIVGGERSDYIEVIGMWFVCEILNAALAGSFRALC
jgi:hypothetical protein